MSIILSSAARTASGTSSSFKIPPRVVAASFLLVVSAAATDVGDTLNVYIQSSEDEGTTYNDFLSFTQVLGNGGAKKFVAKWNGIITPTTALAAPGDATLSAGVAQGPIGETCRIKWVIFDSATVNVSFTFAVYMTARYIGR